MTLGVRQIEALQKLAARPDGTMSAFDFNGLMERSTASIESLFKQGLVTGSLGTKGKVTITQAGRDLLSPPKDDPFALF